MEATDMIGLEKTDERCIIPVVMPKDDGKTKLVEIDGQSVLMPKALKESQYKAFLDLPKEKQQLVLSGPTELQQNFFRIQTFTLENSAKRLAEDLRQEIAPGGQPPHEQLRFTFAPFPTSLTRTSPFFPLSPAEIKNREYVKDIIITSTAWGYIKYRGLKLSSHDEDLLLALLAIMNESGNKVMTEIDGEMTYVYKGPLKPILRAKGIDNPGKAAYESAIESFRIMAGAQFELVVNKKDVKDKEKVRKIFFTNIVSAAQYLPSSQELTIAINPYFANCFIEKSVTLIDLYVRRQLSSPIAKSLYRFIQSHRENEWSGNFLVLATAINISSDLPTRKQKERLKAAISDLIEINILTPASCIAGDTAILIRAHSTSELLQLAKKSRLPHKTKALPSKEKKTPGNRK